MDRDPIVAHSTESRCFYSGTHFAFVSYGKLRQAAYTRCEISPRFSKLLVQIDDYVDGKMDAANS